MDNPFNLPDSQAVVKLVSLGFFLTEYHDASILSCEEFDELSNKLTEICWVSWLVVLNCYVVNSRGNLQGFSFKEVDASILSIEELLSNFPNLWGKGGREHQDLDVVIFR